MPVSDDVLDSLPEQALEQIPAGGALLMYGRLPFGLGSASLAELRRSSAYRWQASDLVGRRPGYQFTGPGAETVRLRGVIMPAYRGGADALELFRAAALEGTPRRLVSGTGDVYGSFVLLRVGEERVRLVSDGRARRIGWEMEFARYDAVAAPGYLASLAEAE